MAEIYGADIDKDRDTELYTGDSITTPPCWRFSNLRSA